MKVYQGFLVDEQIDGRRMCQQFFSLAAYQCISEVWEKYLDSNEYRENALGLDFADRKVPVE